MTSVYLFVPNLIEYLRLVLIVIAYFIFEDVIPFLVVIGFTAILDFIDGYVARRLNQVSAFGAWLDVLVDNVARGMVWSRILPWGCFVSALEWTVFVCTHSSGSKWREAFKHAPWWVQAVMAKGFKTSQGTLVTLGLHVLPLWIYGWQRIEAPLWFALTGFSILLAGRLLAFAVEIWCILTHLNFLVAEERK
ncbi:uncharacterized protein LOC134191523 [Corticium candelabrum]|uniref:uncharacterized protein LOC134191523 n=1 Tax=Corticium candelabrum TaxID=121492 RepID=UPI002E265C63|nr:uncharacterized protein LOC134191523 [Corticium candelabrum]